jgi:membrane-bound lytic murein transglycosylase B
MHATQRKSIPHEVRHAKDAVCLIREELPQPELSKADERREKYRTFLKKVEEDLGMVVAILCGIIFRQTIIGRMTEYHRLPLPSEIRKHEKRFKTSFFQGLVQEYVGP